MARRVRTNIEDDLYTSGRLGKLARTMKWTEREALGGLVLVWRATQDSEIVEATLDHMVSVCAVHFDSDTQTVDFLKAMAAARLATVEGGLICIKGNAAHVQRLGNLRRAASLGGHAKSSMLSLPHGTEEAAIAVPPQCAPYSLLLTPSENTKPKRKPRKPSTPKPDPTLFLAAHRNRLLLKWKLQSPPSISAAERRAATALMKAWGADHVACVEHYVDTNKPFYSNNKWPLGIALQNSSEIWTDWNATRRRREPIAEKTLKDILAEQA